MEHDVDSAADFVVKESYKKQILGLNTPSGLQRMQRV